MTESQLASHNARLVASEIESGVSGDNIPQHGRNESASSISVVGGDIEDSMSPMSMPRTRIRMWLESQDGNNQYPDESLLGGDIKEGMSSRSDGGKRIRMWLENQENQNDDDDDQLPVEQYEEDYEEVYDECQDEGDDSRARE